MSKHTSFRIGGPADFWVRARAFEELAEIVQRCRCDGTDCFVAGSGNNLLVRDGGIEGVVLNLDGESFRRVQRVPEGIKAGAGVRLQRMVGECMRRGLSGCEFLVAIPGSVGGAVYMNAGTRDATVSDRLVRATVLDAEGRVRTMGREEINFGYRESGLGGSVVLEAVFRLEPASPEAVRRRVLDYYSRKRKTQDLMTPSAGSIFKNQAGGLVPSARLIEMSGLKGLRVGGARISPVHANFIVNEGRACAADVESLIERARERVFRDHGVQLELEVRVVGRYRGQA